MGHWQNLLTFHFDANSVWNACIKTLNEIISFSFYCVLVKYLYWQFFSWCNFLLNRSIMMQLMIFVDHAGRIIPGINHSPWNGLTLADFVMPFFLFIVGVSLALTYKVATQNYCYQRDTIKNICWHCLPLQIFFSILHGKIVYISLLEMVLIA